MPGGRSALEPLYRAGDFGATPDIAPAIIFCERRGLAIFVFDGPPNDAAFLAEVEESLGLALPMRPNSVTEAGSHTALWLAPGRWQIEAPVAEAERLTATLGATVEGRRGALLELGQARSVIRVSGPRARDLLGKGCPLDLHRRVFGPGDCAQSLVAGVATTLRGVATGNDGFAIDLQVMRSFGLSFWEWLTVAAEEYGYRVLPPD